jgi:hypothetical protein
VYSSLADLWLSLAPRFQAYKVRVLLCDVVAVCDVDHTPQAYGGSFVHSSRTLERLKRDHPRFVKVRVVWCVCDSVMVITRVLSGGAQGSHVDAHRARAARAAVPGACVRACCVCVLYAVLTRFIAAAVQAAQREDRCARRRGH